MALSFPHRDTFSARILDWYDANARELPWRTGPADRAVGVVPDPYHVWLSEIMLQQTTIPHATRYFLEFVRRWPSVQDLASVDRDEVMAAWAGLGYYSRARNLYACAQMVAEMGGFPETAKELVKLPGIGPYTSGAISAIAFDEPSAAVDGNVERVMSRYLAIEKPIRDAKGDIRTIVEGLVPQKRAGDFAQAMMDLGATVCTPRSPNCEVCPLKGDCQALALGRQADFPVKSPKTLKPTRYGTVSVVVKDGEFALVRRPETGLLAGMMGLPTSEWLTLGADLDVPEDARPTGAVIGRVEHVFTHFRLWLDVTTETSIEEKEVVWFPLESWKSAGLPSVFQKAVKLYLKH